MLDVSTFEIEQLHFGYKVMDRDLLDIMADPRKYGQVISPDIGLWMDKTYDTWNTGQEAAWLTPLQIYSEVGLKLQSKV